MTCGNKEQLTDYMAAATTRKLYSMRQQMTNHMVRGNKEKTLQRAALSVKMYSMQW